MRLPAVQGIIDRRILVNYRVDAEVAARLLPPPFRPKLTHGYAMAGICLIRLMHVRPVFIPFGIGMRSENAAHRIAVEWDRDGKSQTGVYIPRRDSSSRMNAWLGGRIVPGEHHHAKFDIEETDDCIKVAYESDDGSTRVKVVAALADALNAESVFSTLEEASRFYESGSVGYSATRDVGRFDGLELRCRTWDMQALTVQSVHSSFFDDVRVFPAGSVTFDCALLMKNVEHVWHSCEDLCCKTV